MPRTCVLPAFESEDNTKAHTKLQRTFTSSSFLDARMTCALRRLWGLSKRNRRQGRENNAQCVRICLLVLDGASTAAIRVRRGSDFLAAFDVFVLRSVGILVDGQLCWHSKRSQRAIYACVWVQCVCENHSEIAIGGVTDARSQAEQDDRRCSAQGKRMDKLIL
jgi:hypothetical protein